MTIKHLHQKRAHCSALLFLLLCVVGMTKSYAVDYDFSAVCSTGQTLYYRITNSTTHEVALTYPYYVSYEYSISTLIAYITTYWYGYDKPIGDVIIPEHVMHDGISYSVTSIRDHTFGDSRLSHTSGYVPLYSYDEGCAITSIVIPSSITDIGSDAFARCSSLTKMVVLAETPPALGNSVFYNVNKGIPVDVPYGSLGAYQNSSGWNEFFNYQEVFYKTIPGYGTGNGNWQFIASPLAENTAPTTVDNMITETPYDLYRFDQSEDAEWQNYKANSFNLVNGQGYLYANSEDMNLVFKGNFNEDETKEVELAYDANADFAGWNLVGNPFPVSAYANRSYFVMNEEGSAIEPVAVSSSTAIAPCTGVMVKAEGSGESVTFSKTVSNKANNQGNLQITMMENTLNMNGVSTGSTTVDNAIVSFNAGDALEKFVFNSDNARLSIKKDGKDYAIAYAEKQGEMPLNFKATKNGSYTLSVVVENADVDYLHLIDNLKGADVDLLVEPSYTFEATPNDYASRFKLVFVSKDDALEGAESFGYFADGRLVIPSIEGIQTLQVVDMLGHVLMSERVICSYDKQLNLTPGVYVVRLNEQTQKMVVK